MTETDALKQEINEANDRTRNITRGLGSLTIQNIFTSALGFIFLGVLLRTVSYNGYNAYSSAQVTIGIAALVASFGLQTASARYFAYLRGEEGEDKAWIAARAILILGLIFTSIVTLVFAGMSEELSFYFTKSAQYTVFFIIASSWLFTASFSAILQGIIQGMKRYSLLAKVLLISRILSVAFAVSTLELSHNADYAISSWAIFYGIIIIWSFKIIWPELIKKRDFTKEGKKEQTRRSLYSQILRFATPLAIAGILNVVSTSGDSVVLGGYTQSLGVYNAVITILGVLNIVLITPLNTAVLPEMSSSAKTASEVSNGTRLALRLLALGLLPISLLVAAVSSQLLTLFSHGGVYLEGILPLEIIAATFVLVGIQNVGFMILQALGKTFQALVASAVMAVADVSLALIMVPGLGILGATTSKVFVAVIGAVVTLYFIKSYLHSLDNPVFYAKAITAAAIPSFLIFILSLRVSDSLISLVPYAILWGVLFLACAKVLKLLTDEDRNFVVHLVPKSFQKYIKYL